MGAWEDAFRGQITGKTGILPKRAKLLYQTPENFCIMPTR
jgi:hypothetical protein